MEFETRINQLSFYIRGLLEQQDALALYEQYKEAITSVQPEDLFQIFTAVLNEGYAADDILMHLDKVIHVVYNSLYQTPYTLRPNLFLDSLNMENQGLIRRLADITQILTTKTVQERIADLQLILEDLTAFTVHYAKKENILFPMLEKKDHKFDGLAIMWALHNQIRTMLKEAQLLVKQKPLDVTAVTMAVGNAFFVIRSLVMKEEMLLFKVSSTWLSAEEEQDLLNQSFEYGFPLITENELQRLQANRMTHQTPDFVPNQLFYQTTTGSMSFEQLAMVLGALPVDLSFVDEDNILRYFSKPKDRIFFRSEAAIGRNVKHCHPPQSVDKVLEIIHAFKENRQDHAMFWITMKERKILIQYFALRNEHGVYKGVLEVSQDITEIQQLEGERRLLAWEL